MHVTYSITVHVLLWSIIVPTTISGVPHYILYRFTGLLLCSYLFMWHGDFKKNVNTCMSIHEIILKQSSLTLISCST